MPSANVWSLDTWRGRYLQEERDDVAPLDERDEADDDGQQTDHHHRQIHRRRALKHEPIG